MSISRIAMLAGLLLVAGVAHAQGDAAAGKSKSATCAGCHGADGNSLADTFPKIAGQHPGYITKQLVDYKSGARVNATMAPMAEALSDQDMADLAAFFSAQPSKVGVTNPDYLERGAKLYRGGDARTGIPACMSCHDPSGAGNRAARFPALGGQHATYTEATLKAFRAGERNNDSAAMMRSIAIKMTDRDIKAVSEFISGLY